MHALIAGRFLAFFLQERDPLAVPERKPLLAAILALHKRDVRQEMLATGAKAGSVQISVQPEKTLKTVASQGAASNVSIVYACTHTHM